MYRKELMQTYKCFLYYKIIIFDIVVKISENLYKQEFYSDDYCLLDEVLQSEIDRLYRIEIDVEDWRFSISRCGDVFFYLTLYFSSMSGEPLVYENVYGSI